MYVCMYIVINVNVLVERRSYCINTNAFVHSPSKMSTFSNCILKYFIKIYWNEESIEIINIEFYAGEQHILLNREYFSLLCSSKGANKRNW